MSKGPPLALPFSERFTCSTWKSPLDRTTVNQKGDLLVAGPNIPQSTL